MSWEEDLHTRGRDGKFISMHARVKVDGKVGTITGGRNTPNGVRLSVKFDNGTKKDTVMSHQVMSIGGSHVPSQHKPADKSWVVKTSDRVEQDLKPLQPPEHKATPKAVPIRGLTGTHKDHVSAAMERQAAFAPKTFGSLSGVHGMSKEESAQFEATHGAEALGGFNGSHILVGKGVLGAKAERDFQKDHKSGWYSRTDANGIQNFVSHESGHFLDHQIQRRGPEAAKPIWNEIAKQFGLKPPFSMNKRGLDNWLAKPENNKVLSAAVSRYGATASDELFAEIWASFTTSTSPSAQIAAIGKVMAATAEKGARA